MAEVKPVLQFDSVKAMREEIKRLKIAIGDAAKSGDDCSESIERLNDVNKILNSTLAKSKGESDAVSDSIAGMEQQYKALQNTLRVLSEDQKKNGIGKELAKQASEISEQLNNAKKDIGDYKNNIGHYADGVEEAFEKMGISVKGLTGPMQLASKGASGLSKAMKALFANPWALAIAAIVLVLKKLVDAFKNNKAAMDNLKKAMEPLQPIMNAFNNVLGLISEALGKVVGWIANGLANAFDWLLGALPTIANKVIDVLNIVTIPIRLMVTEIGTLVNVFAALKSGKGIEGVKDAFRNFGKELKDNKIPHVTADLTKLKEETKYTTQETDKNTDAVKDNTKAQEDNKKALEEREKAIEELKKRLDESGKSELDKLEERYAKERELIKDNVEYAKKLDQQYAIERNKLLRDYYNKYTSEFDSAVSDIPELKIGTLNTSKTATEGIIQNLTSELTHFKEAYAEVSKVLNIDRLNEFATEFNEHLKESGYEFELMGDNLSEDLIGQMSLELVKLQRQLRDIQKDTNDTIAIFGDDAFNRLDKGIEGASRALDIMNKSLEKSKDKDNSDIDNKIGVTWWGAVGTDAVGDQIQNERDFQDQSYNNLVQYLQSCIAAYGVELENFKGTEEQKSQMLAEQTDLRTQLMEAELQHEIDINNRRIEDNKRAVEETKKGMQGLANILDNAGGAWETLLNVQIDTGKKSKEELTNQFKVVRRIQSASAMVNALLSANEAYSSLASIPYVGPVLGAAAAAAALASGIANVVAISKQDESGADTSSGSTPSVMAPTLIESTPYEYVRNLQTVEEEDELNKPMYVRVTDIEAGLEQSRVRTAESSF